MKSPQHLDYLDLEGTSPNGDQRSDTELPKIKKKNPALADMAHWIEHLPVKQRVAGSIPSQGTCLGCGPGPQ